MITSGKKFGNFFYLFREIIQDELANVELVINLRPLVADLLYVGSFKNICLIEQVNNKVLYI